MTVVPILMYHEITRRVDSRFARYSVTAETFARHLRYLRLAGHTPVTLDALLGGARSAPGPRRPVVITFDDGLRSCIEEAAPLLAARRYTATFFVVAGLVGGRSEWTAAELGTTLPLADWPALRELCARGFDCGAHSLTHPRLTAVTPARADEEIRGCRALLEERLGRPVRHFAYPFGAHDHGVRALVEKAGYTAACGTAPGRASLDDDRFALPRVPVYGHESVLDLACRLRTGAPFRAWLRSRAGRAAARRA